MKVWEAALGPLVGARTEARSTHTVDDWLSWFTFAGNDYAAPLQTTWGSQASGEEVISSTSVAYRSNGPVFSLVLARMLVFSEARFQWRRFEGGRPTELFGNSELALLERPWRGGTTGDLLARMEQGASLAGNAFVRRIRRGSADRLAVLRPEWVSIVLGSQEDADHPNEAGDAEVVAYLYRPGGDTARTVVLLPDEVAHYAPIPDPNAQFRGMSWITPALTDVRSDQLATMHKSRFFENAATPNLGIKFDPKTTKEQILEFKKIIEADHEGAWNAYRTLFLGGGADPVVLGKDFKELEFRATTGAGETRLAAAAGVPPVIAGFSEGLEAATYSNYAQARRRFADGTMRPLWRNAASSLEVLLRPEPGAHLWYDTRDIAFLREDSKDEADIFNARARAIRTLVDGGFDPVTVTSAVDAMDVTLLEHTGKTSVQLHDPEDGDEGEEDDDDADG